MIRLNSLTTVKNTKDARDYRASLVNGKWVVRIKDILYPIQYEPDACNRLRYIFSSPTNDYWPIGTPRRHEKLHVENYVNYGFWTPFREGFKFRGTLINNVIHVDWQEHQNRVRELYGKSCSQVASK